MKLRAAGAVIAGAALILGALNLQALAQSRTAAKGDQIIIPRLEFRDATLNEAVMFLARKSQELDTSPDPAARGVNIITKQPPGHGSATHIPGFDPPGAAAAPRDHGPRVSLSLASVTLTAALKAVADRLNYEVQAEPHAFYLAPKADPTLGRRAAAPAGAGLEKQLQEIIVPRLEFREASLSETTDFLRRKAIELGVVKMTVVLPSSADEANRITLSLRNAPLSEALGYVARLASLELEWAESHVALKPLRKQQ